jgi:hypothetical protein
MAENRDKRERRITVIISRDLHRRAKIKAAETDTPVSVVVRDALRKWTGYDEDEEG